MTKLYNKKKEQALIIVNENKTLLLFSDLNSPRACMCYHINVNDKVLHLCRWQLIAFDRINSMLIIQYLGNLKKYNLIW